MGTICVLALACAVDVFILAKMKAGLLRGGPKFTHTHHIFFNGAFCYDGAFTRTLVLFLSFTAKL